MKFYRNQINPFKDGQLYITWHTTADAAVAEAGWFLTEEFRNYEVHIDIVQLGSLKADVLLALRYGAEGRFTCPLKHEPFKKKRQGSLRLEVSRL